MSAVIWVKSKQKLNQGSENCEENDNMDVKEKKTINYLTLRRHMPDIKYWKMFEYDPTRQISTQQAFSRDHGVYLGHEEVETDSVPLTLIECCTVAFLYHTQNRTDKEHFIRTHRQRRPYLLISECLNKHAKCIGQGNMDKWAQNQ